jgi:hypothetical protein
MTPDGDDYSAIRALYYRAYEHTGKFPAFIITSRPILWFELEMTAIESTPLLLDREEGPLRAHAYVQLFRHDGAPPLEYCEALYRVFKLRETDVGPVGRTPR